MEKELLDKQELSAKLEKEATLLSTNVETAKVVFNSYNELKKLLTGVVEKSKEVEKLKELSEKYQGRFQELGKQKQEQYNCLDNVKQSAYIYSQDLQKIKDEKLKQQDVVDKLKAIVATIDNADIKKGYEEETSKLNALVVRESEYINEYDNANTVVKEETKKFSYICNEIAKLNTAQAETLEKIKNLTKEVQSDNEKIVGLQKKDNVNVGLIDIIVETAKKIGYYNALASSDVKVADKEKETEETTVEKAIKAVVTTKQVPEFTVDLLKELYVKVLESDDNITDNRDRLVIELKDFDSLDKEFKLLDIFFDDYIENPVMLEDKDRVPYISANRQGTAYSKLQHMKYDASGEKSYPPVSRAFSYVISGLKAIHKITDIDIMNRMNGLVEDKKVEYASLIESNPQYKLFNKKSGYIVLAVSDTRFLAIPRVDYNLTFLADLADSYGHNLKCVCKKGGRIGNDR